MRPLTDDRPKPMVEVLGRPLIDHTLEIVRKISPSRIVINTHYKAEALAKHLQGQDVVIHHEKEKILDTGGGLKAARHLIAAETCFSINPDVIWRGPNALQDVMRHWKPEVMDALLLCAPLHRVHGRNSGGDFDIDPEGHLSRGGDYVYTGVQILKLERVMEITDEVFSLNALWNILLNEKRLFGHCYQGHWCDVGQPSGIPTAEHILTHPL